MRNKILARYVLTIYLNLVAYFLPAQSIQPLQSKYMFGEEILIDYTGGTGSPTDWIGFYKINQVPGVVSSTVWKYIPSKEGRIRFAGSLPPGLYDIHLLCCDKYDILASFKKLEIIDSRISSFLKIYRSDDTIQIKIMSVSKGDELSIYNSNDVVNGLPQAQAVAVKKFIVENTSLSNIVYKTNLIPNKYIAILKNSMSTMENVNFIVKPPPHLPDIITKIGIGSCANQNNPQPTMDLAIKEDIDAFVFCGDNLYIDTYSPQVMQEKYQNFLVGREEYQNLRSSVPIWATWDDHDYGCCDEDKDYAHKDASQKMFLDFYKEPIESPRRNQKGIYTSYIHGPLGKRIQVIMLDTRYFLDNKRVNNGCGKNDYCPWSSIGDTSKTILGNEQWQWLKTELTKPADLRMIVSSVQFGPSYNGWEGWSIFPHERQKMQKLLLDTKAEGVFFVSGDIHYSEVSKMKEADGLYPIYDFTASAINQSWPPEINANRIPALVYGDPNVGIIDINWDEKIFTLKCIDNMGAVRFQHKISFDELKIKPSKIIENEVPKYQLINTSGGFEIIMDDSMNFNFELFDNSGKLISDWPHPSTSISKNGLLPGIYYLIVKKDSIRSSIKILIQ